MLTIGADPEFFIASAKTLKPVAIIDKLGGTKDNPFRKDTWPTGYAVQEDNVMAEYNIPPCFDSYSFAEAIIYGQRLVMETVGRSYRRFEGCCVKFDHATLQHPQALRFGCSPDNDGYNMGRPHELIRAEALNEPDGGWRFAGGHIHMGYNEDIPWCPPFVMAAMADAFVSLPLIANGYDLQGPRRKFYGLPGRFRQTPYGIEYRTLGNGWTGHETSAERAGRYTMNLLQTLQSAGEPSLRVWYHEFPWPAIRNAIMTENRELCQALWAQTQGIVGRNLRAA